MGQLHVDGVVHEDKGEEEGGDEGRWLDDGDVGDGRTDEDDEDPPVEGEEVGEEAHPGEVLPHLRVVVGAVVAVLVLLVVGLNHGVGTIGVNKINILIMHNFLLSHYCEYLHSKDEVEY
jgi:hypothetical protein